MGTSAAVVYHMIWYPTSVTVNASSTTTAAEAARSRPRAPRPRLRQTQNTVITGRAKTKAAGPAVPM